LWWPTLAIDTRGAPAKAARMAGITHFFDDEPVRLRAKTIGVYVVLILINALAWIWALVAFRPVLLGTASLAYTFGLRHGVDPDHIAAIDNVTRKLMQQGKRPLYTGFFFALGHSTVVVIASVLVALSVAALQARFAGFKEIGGVIGTSVSALFLLGISAANIVILMSVYRMFAAVRRGDRLIEDDLHDVLAQRCFLGRMLRSLFGIITRAGTCTRWGCCLDSASIPPAKSACSAFPRLRARRDCRCGRSWFFRRCSPPECRWSIPPMAS
jgi:high-affinity nickel permease